MSKVDVLNSGWIDLVFEGRNKAYGAYQLRKESSKTTLVAFITGVGIIGLLVAIPVGINYFKGEKIIPPTGIVLPETTVIQVELPAFEEPKKPEPVIEEPAGAAAPKIKPTTAFTQPVATSEPVTTPAPTTDDFKNSDPDAITTAGSTTGSPTGVATTTPTNGTGEGTGTAPNGTGIATTNTVDVMPAYPGGLEAFYEAVGRRFRIPEVDSAKTMKVYVSFVVETDGTMTNIKVARDPGYGLGNEAMRVLKSIKTKWKPGQIKGVNVRTAYNLPITVNIK